MSKCDFYRSDDVWPSILESAEVSKTKGGDHGHRVFFSTVLTVVDQRCNNCAIDVYPQDNIEERC
jgi:hypothetical protein